MFYAERWFDHGTDVIVMGQGDKLHIHDTEVWPDDVDSEVESNSGSIHRRTVKLDIADVPMPSFRLPGTSSWFRMDRSALADVAYRTGWIEPGIHDYIVFLKGEEIDLKESQDWLTGSQVIVTREEHTRHVMENYWN